MSLYNIRTDTIHQSLTAQWDTLSDESTINVKIGTDFVATIPGFEGYENIPVNFSNDRIMEESIIFTSKDSLDTEPNDPVTVTKNINLIINPNIIKANPLKGFKN